jgi:hypothetical protein
MGAVASAAVLASSATATTITVGTGQGVLPGVANSSSATYGAPTAATFYEPGPLTVGSGTSAELFAGPKPGQKDVDYLLFVLSGDVSSLGSKTISFSLQGNGSYTGGGSVSFGFTDFFSTASDGFPASITSIANGEVNGIKFPDASHAAVMVSGFNFGNIATGTVLADVVVTSPINLRVDVFGVDPPANHGSGGTVPTTTADFIINNAPNSGALGVTGSSPSPAVPDGGSTMMLLGAALTGLAGISRRSKN